MNSPLKVLDVYIRRCHLCGESSETTEGKIIKCGHCGRSLAPFFFFNECDVPVFGDAEIRKNYFGDHGSDAAVRVGPRDSKSSPHIWGIAVFWGAE